MNNIEQKEAQFHDQWAEDTNLNQVYVDQAFESISGPENRQILAWMGDLKGKKVLELGCGLGEASVYFAKKGADVTSTDISPKMVETAEKLAQLHGTSVKGLVVSANNLNNIPDNFFDYTYAGNLLHHVDIVKCITELRPKLKDGGQAFFWDPIAYNPVINIYRRIATKVRTEDEHPLKREDIENIKKVFSKVEIQYYWLTSLGVFLWFFAVKRIDPNKERYWKKILEDSDKLEPFLKLSQKVDSFLFKWLPPLRYLAWNIVLKCNK